MAIIESGKIAKNPKGSMTIETPTMTLGIKGTRFNISNKPDGTSEVGLAEDSFGNVGAINVSSKGKLQTLFDTEQVISVNLETGISERPKSDEEKKELADASKDLIEASSIDENIIQKILKNLNINFQITLKLIIFLVEYIIIKMIMDISMKCLKKQIIKT